MNRLRNWIQRNREIRRLRRDLLSKRREVTRAAAEALTLDRATDARELEQYSKQIEGFSAIAENLRYDVPRWLSAIVILSGPFFLTFAWYTNTPYRVPVVVVARTSHVDFTLSERFIFTSGIGLVGDGLHILSEQKVRIKPPLERAGQDLWSEQLDLSFIPPYVDKDRAVLNRLQVEEGGRFSFEQRYGMLLINTHKSKLQASLTVLNDFELHLGDAGEGVKYLDLQSRPKYKPVEIWLKSNQTAQLDMTPNWRDVEFVKMPISRVSFSSRADREEAKANCHLLAGEVAFVHIGRKQALRKGDCLNLKNFEGTATIEGSADGLQVTLVGSADRILVGPEKYPQDATPRLLEDLASERLAQSAAAILGTGIMGMLVQYLGRKL